MALITFPYSPLPATMTRQKNWNENNNVYDSGDVQGFSNWVRPLYIYSIPIKLMTEIHQSSLWNFYDRVKGQTIPWLMKDPYDNFVNSVVVAGSGVTNAATLFIRDLNSYMVRADTTTVATLSSVLSVYVTNGAAFSYQQDSGLLTVNSKAPTDVWGARSITYFKKVKFNSPMVENDTMWNTFAIDNLSIIELP